MKEKIIIGRDYWPSQTLRRMPSGWQLEEAKRKESRIDQAVFIFCVSAFVAFYAFNIYRAFN